MTSFFESITKVARICPQINLLWKILSRTWLFFRFIKLKLNIPSGRWAHSLFKKLKTLLTFLNSTVLRKSFTTPSILMVLRSEQYTSLHKSKGLQAVSSDFQSDNWCGQTLCDKMDGTLFLGRRKYKFGYLWFPQWV